MYVRGRVVYTTFEIFHMILTQFIFRDSIIDYKKKIVFLFKILTAEKSSLLLWNVFEKILDPKKSKSPQDGTLLELKKGGDPCNCRKFLFGFIIEPKRLQLG